MRKFVNRYMPEIVFTAAVIAIPGLLMLYAIVLNGILRG